MSEIFEIEEVANLAANRAGELIVGARTKDLQVNYKGIRNLITPADLAAEKLIVEIIKKAFPEHNILAEETSPDFSSPSTFQGPLWVIDPIDGTTGYARGHNHTAVSIAFAQDGVVQYGIVHAPFVGETFTAKRSKGAFLNGIPITVSKVCELTSALVGTGFPYDRTDIGRVLDRLGRVIKSCMDIRRLGAASLDISWVACGRLDVFYENLMPWDIAAGCLIAREAGAIIHHLSSEQKGSLPPELNGNGLVVCTPGVSQAFIQLLENSCH